MDLHWPYADRDELLRLKSIRILFTGRVHLLRILFDPTYSRLRSSPQQIFCSIGGLSHGEIILVSIAMDIWNGSGQTNLHEAIHVLDDKCWSYFLQAMAIFSIKCEPK